MKNKKSLISSLLIFALIVGYYFFAPDAKTNSDTILPLEQSTSEPVIEVTAEPPFISAENGTSGEDQLTAQPLPEDVPVEPGMDEDGSYSSKEDVALYIHLFGHLPSNFITKKDAEKLGWSGGSLEPYAPGKSIGGSHFGNYEGLLPYAKGRNYTECDIDTIGAKTRGAKRIVFSNDGLIYYTEDHYESFELLYGEP